MMNHLEMQHIKEYDEENIVIRHISQLVNRRIHFFIIDIFNALVKNQKPVIGNWR